MRCCCLGYELPGFFCTSEKERELLWVGEQFRQAIALYYYRTPGTVKRYPESLVDLLEDKRHLSVQRYLRRIYLDPVSGKAEWGLVRAPGGGIMGVHSLSDAPPLKRGGFAPAQASLEGAARYAEWRFVYEPPSASPQATP
ncbi:MAG: type II secretion system protein [Burkholderiales bacterium]